MGENIEKMFLICPVRNSKKDYNQVVQKLEQKYKVHWPPRDTDQKDTIGFRICTDNMKAIQEADIIGVIWDGESQGCLFDLGIAFALGKNIKIINIPEKLNKKSFQDMMIYWSEK